MLLLANCLVNAEVSLCDECPVLHYAASYTGKRKSKAVTVLVLSHSECRFVVSLSFLFNLPSTTCELIQSTTAGR